jgi:hypothetical protein
MPNLYFWEPEKQNHGILHAVLAWDDCDRVLGCASTTRLGPEFPTESMNVGGAAMVAILYVHPDEANQVWVAGFYRIDTDATKIHDALGTLKRIPAVMTGINGSRC